MEYQKFKSFVEKTTEIILADLDNLQNIADEANAAVSTVTIQTTRRPDDEYFEFNETIDESRCTIPIVMVCFSAVDMIGQWLKEYADDDFGSSAHCFFDQLSRKDDLKRPTSQNKIKEFIRNGVMHSFFAKKGYGITYPTFDSNSLFTDNVDTGTTLDARYLLQVVRFGLKKLGQEIEDEKSEISQKAFYGYKKWLNK